MEKYYYGYDEFLKDAKELTKVVATEYKPDTLLSIARGGLTLAHFMAEALHTNRLFVLNSIHYDGTKKLDTFNIFNIPNLSDAQKVLIIDDISDSGETLREVLKILKEKYPDVEYKIATIFYKPHTLVMPDFTLKEAKLWIDFLWEVDPLID